VSEIVEAIVLSVLIGAGATLLVDLWALFQARCFGAPAPDWALVGRWFGGFPNGRFVHDNTANAPAIPGELAIGWIAHYVIGVAYAALMLAIFGLSWARQPTLLPALSFGVITVLAPFFLMQPGLGQGVAASKTANPGAARARSVMAHTVFGLGLYLWAWICALLIRTLG
jgi:Protein of unknown function (DUF2938)